MAKKILIVDDDNDFREAMSDLLDAKGYTVLSASDGKSGFDVAKKENPDLILLDVMMSSKTEGFDIAKSLQSDSSTKNTPVIIITGIRKDMNLSFGLEPDSDWLPVKAVLEKPVKPEVLLKAVEENIKN